MKVSRVALRTTFALAAVAALAAGCASHPPRTVTVSPPPQPTVVTPGGTVVAPAPVPNTTVLTPVPGGSVAMPVSSADVADLMQISQDSLAEVRLAQMAAQRSSNEQVRSLAQRLISDHTRLNSQLYSLAQQRGVAIPQTLDSMHQATEQRFAALSGPQFDTAFLEHMIGDHAKAAAVLERLAAGAVDPSVRAWATAQLPLFREHLAQSTSAHAGLARTMGIAGGGVQPSASPIIIVPSR